MVNWESVHKEESLRFRLPEEKGELSEVSEEVPLRDVGVEEVLNDPPRRLLSR